MVPGKMVLWKKGPLEKNPPEKKSPEKWPPGKKSPRERSPEKWSSEKLSLEKWSPEKHPHALFSQYVGFWGERWKSSSVYEIVEWDQ